jgi:hypothetical protein
MLISRMMLALVLAGPFVFGQLPSIAERALKRQKQKEENDARHAAAVEKQKANEEARQKAREEGIAAGQERKAKAAEENAAATKERNDAVAARSAARKSSKPDPNAEQGITGPLHEKYMKRVVFLSADKEAEQVAETDIIQEFTLGKPAYFRVYMEQSGPKALTKVTPETSLNDLALGLFYGMRISLDGKPPMDLKFSQFSTKPLDDVARVLREGLERGHEHRPGRRRIPRVRGSGVAERLADAG